MVQWLERLVSSLNASYEIKMKPNVYDGLGSKEEWFHLKMLSPNGHSIDRTEGLYTLVPHGNREIST